MNLNLFAALVILASSAGPALAADPHPPQIVVSFLAEPAPLTQNGSTKLVYEMQLANFVSSRYVIDSIEASAGDAHETYDAAALSPMTLRFDDRGRTSAPSDPRALEGGRGAVVFFLLDLGKAKAPATIAHKLTVIDDKGEKHEIEPASLAVRQESPIVVAPPLMGTWIAGDSVNNGKDAAHRRAILVAGGHPWLAQRYAIDFVQVRKVDGKFTTWSGPENKNENYFCYDQPIHSVADGTVVAASDGMAENVPHSGAYAAPIGFDNAGGNYAVIEIAPNRYAFYAHMRPGTVKVKVGDKVRAGELIGRVGNTGSSTEPHLHFHVVNQPSFLAADGVPFAFAKGLASGPVEADVSSPDAITFGAIGPQKPFVDDYPAPNALVTFE